MLKKVADFYQEEVDATIDALTSIIDPVMILGVGLIIGGTLIAMYLPMFDLVGTIKA
jgi:type IV pilus assembly protein PilC